ncbi:MAG TPA: exosortase A [Rhodocyclaceae bacterium]|nr:exosortase A [Rhodocyclaceae bacterium]
MSLTEVNSARLAGKTAAPGWTPALGALFALLAWIGVWYWQTLSGMVAIWARSDTFAHGFVVAPIALWLVWRARDALMRESPAPAPWVLLPALLLGTIWLAGDLVAANAATQFAVVGMIIAAVVAVLGRVAAGVIAFPLAFLFFAVPVGEFMMPTLMEGTATVTIYGLQLSGIPVYRQGLTFVIPSGNWSVVEACSGVRYLIASLMVGSLFAYLNYVSLRRRLIFFAVSALVPIVANWVRAYLIVMLGHLSGNRLAAGVDHLVYGWLFFGIVIAAMFYIGTRWSEDPPALEAPAALANAAAPAVGRLVMVVIAMAAIVVLPRVLAERIQAVDGAAPVDLAIPQNLGKAGEWASSDVIPVFQPAYRDYAALGHRVYRNGSDEVGVYVAYYRGQGYGRKMISSVNALLKSQDPDWIAVEKSTGTVDSGSEGRQVRVFQLQQPGQSDAVREGIEVWQWYWLGGKTTVSDLTAKVDLAMARFAGQADDSAIIVLYAAKGGRPTGEILSQFVREAGSDLDRLLAATRDRR